MKVIGYKNKISVLAGIVSAVHDPKISLTAVFFQIPGLLSMIRNIRIAQSLIVCSLGLCLHIKKRIFLSYVRESPPFFMAQRALGILSISHPIFLSFYVSYTSKSWVSKFFARLRVGHMPKGREEKELLDFLKKKINKGCVLMFLRKKS